MADASYETEVQNFRTLIKLQKSGSGNGGGESRVLCHPWIVFNDWRGVFPEIYLRSTWKAASFFVAETWLFAPTHQWMHCTRCKALFLLFTAGDAALLVTNIEPQYYVARRHLRKLGNKVRHIYTPCYVSRQSLSSVMEVCGKHQNKLSWQIFLLKTCIFIWRACFLFEHSIVSRKGLIQFSKNADRLRFCLWRQ